jgi:hypothetical protein
VREKEEERERKRKRQIRECVESRSLAVFSLTHTRRTASLGYSHCTALSLERESDPARHLVPCHAACVRESARERKRERASVQASLAPKNKVRTAAAAAAKTAAAAALSLSLSLSQYTQKLITPLSVSQSVRLLQLMQ